MTITLHPRTEKQVRIYFERTQNEQIKKFLPSAAETLTDALRMFREVSEGKTASFGRTIFADGTYIGDIWCYGINEAETPGAMLSFCIFETAYWGKGAASAALRLFLRELNEKFTFRTLGAFTYADNMACRRVLEKNGFLLLESFNEDGRASCYYQKEW